ncbi:hypothetical protein SAY87_024110 [Trapa incisa]|uniref:Uncharacterized protein n=1 Tax=Trapa incisa TaxID=236973 RepID=A0AAN7QQX1_9MYRT|nr:hypothetical protein SAY87_024110 [Trapa incisa]
MGDRCGLTRINRPASAVSVPPLSGVNPFSIPTSVKLPKKCGGGSCFLFSRTIYCADSGQLRSPVFPYVFIQNSTLLHSASRLRLRGLVAVRGATFSRVSSLFRAEVTLPIRWRIQPRDAGTAIIWLGAHRFWCARPVAAFSRWTIPWTTSIYLDCKHLNS